MVLITPVSMHAVRGIGKIKKYAKYTQRIHLQRYSTSAETKLVEKRESEYPPILDVSEIAEELRKKDAYYEKIKNLKTVEEKLFAINFPRYFGWPAYHLHEEKIPYDYLPLVQFVTRTDIQECKTLPVYTDNAHTREVLKQVKSELERVLLFEVTGKKYKHDLILIKTEDDEIPEMTKKQTVTRHIIQQVNSAITRVLAPEHIHLFTAQLDFEPRVESFWRVGGFHATKEDKKLRESKEFSKDRIDEPIDRYFMYFGAPILQLRSKLPLPELTDESKIVEEVTNKEELLVTDGNGPEPTLLKYPLQEYRYDANKYLQLERERVHGAIIPGFWPNDPHRFGLLSYHDTNHLSERPEEYGEEDKKEALHCQAILASHAWLLGQACYQGFSFYYDITYPFSTQTILTDGKLFSFYQYQLNTTVLHTNATSPDNPLKNNCYATLSNELYHDIGPDGIVGWNDQVLLHLISMYMNAPQERPGVNLTPYLDPQEKLLANIADVKKRIFLHERFRFCISHRKRHHLAPEIYDWERIFKIDHMKRPLDKRIKFFARFKDPINDRILLDHKPVYIPKACRLPGKEKIRFEENYYPDCLPDYKDVV